MERRCSKGGALVLSVVLVVSVLGSSFAGHEHHERTEEEEEMITGDQSSGEGGVDVARSRIHFGEPEAEQSKENQRREAEEEETPTTTSLQKTAVAKEDGQETTTAQSSDAAEAGGEAVAASPSAKVIIWDESVDLATIDPNQDTASAAGERKEPPKPSQERHSDVEASKKTGAGEESQIASEGRSHVNSASSLSSSSIWKTALFAIFGSPVLLFLMKNDLDSTSKQQSYNRCSNSQCNRCQETSNREQLTCEFTHHSSAPYRNATSMAIQNS